MIKLDQFPQCCIEDSYFVVSRLFVNGTYDVNFFVKAELLVYLDLCRVKYSSKGTSAAGYKSYINQFNYINPAQYKQIIQRFINKNFLVLFKKVGKITYFGVLFPPLVDGSTHEILQLYPDIFSSTFYMDAKKHNYIRLPKKSFLAIIKELTLVEIYVLLKLYRYNGLYTFGGCEDSVINNTNGLFLHENFYKDIHLSQQEAADVIKKFIKNHIAFWVIIVKEETIIDGKSYYFYISDKSLFKCKLTAKHKTEIVLRLYHQPPLIKEADYV